MPRPRAWRGIAFWNERSDLFDRLRRRDGSSARLRHRDRNHSPMVLRPARLAGSRRPHQRRGRFFPRPSLRMTNSKFGGRAALVAIALMLVPGAAEAHLVETGLG